MFFNLKNTAIIMSSEILPGDDLSCLSTDMANAKEMLRNCKILI